MVKAGQAPRPQTLARLTEADWRMLNRAMAAYVAEDWQSAYGWTEEEAMADIEQAETTWRKVQQRLKEN